MLSNGGPYFNFLDWKRNTFANQRQEGSLFVLFNSHVQIVGIDTDFDKFHRYPDGARRQWLRARLAEGRAAGRINILLSADEPYSYGSADVTDLWNKDLKDHVGDMVDLWFWGNTHHCALFDRTADTPFIGSCIGHAGYPYMTRSKNKPTPAPLMFLETTPRFPAWTGIRQDMGNNGYVRMTLASNGEVALQYVDWMGGVRCDATVSRDAQGVVRVTSLREHPAA